MKRIFHIVTASLLFSFIACADRTRAELKPLEGWDTPPTEKAAIFEKNLHELHDVDGMILSDIIIITDPDGGRHVEPAFHDSGYWTGNYLLGETLRYALTKDPEAKENCIRSARALIRMTRASGKPGLLVRGYIDANLSGKYLLYEDPNGPTVLSADGMKYLSLDTSIDQLIGVMQGFYFTHRFIDDEPLRAEIAQAVTELLDELIANNYQMLDIDGKPTLWGVMTPGLISSDLHALLTLAIFKTGAYITGNPRFEETYRYLRVDEGYGAKSRTAQFPAMRNYSDDSMEYMSYIGLLELETDPAARADYLASMRRSWKTVKYHDKAFLSLVMLHYFENLPDRDNVLKRTLEQIYLFPTEKTHRTVDFCSYKRPDPKYPYPANFRPVDGYYWTTDTFACAEIIDPNRVQISTGVDYILAYWLARYWGFLNE